ncbi:PREDICTED: glucose-1-phosphatase-like [Papilio polytes]|uniref:glucose-1-phosphatase-like n=1 Tax=Papilio polytes TaxID=76194 RepID=UPI0006767720|nr:PREDICTED: glucose-1-phosphatase-like [Papilio polytes]
MLITKPWLQKEGLLESSCPTEDLFYAYANAKQRTKASAMSFVEKAFPNCNIKVHFKGESDPVFNPVIHNTTAHFRNIAFKEMEARLKDLTLNNSLLFIENILDYRDSKQCKVKKECDLCADENSIDLNVGYKPNVLGPLKVAKSVIDSFVMSYYEGFPMKDVAWDLINDDTQWQLVMAISRGYHDVIFNTTLVAKDIASPLIKYISDVFMNKKGNPKVTLVMGHDANILTVLNSMNFKAFNLHDQFEKSPVGGKLVFQKWYNPDSEKNFLKVNYVYQSTDQLRDGSDLTIESPPQFIQLELNDCKVDKSGFCPWDDFIMFLKTLL